MKLIKIGKRYINPEKISVVYEYVDTLGDKQTVVIVGGSEQEFATTREDIESVVRKITQEGATDGK